MSPGCRTFPKSGQPFRAAFSFVRVPRFRVHASERENKTHTHTTRAKKGPVWLFLKRAPGGIKRGRGNPTNRPNPTCKLACSQCVPLPSQSGREKGVKNVPPLVVTGVGVGKLPNHYCQSLHFEIHACFLSKVARMHKGEPGCAFVLACYVAFYFLFNP